MPLYRRIEPNAQLMEFKCVEFVEELMSRPVAEEPAPPLILRMGMEGCMRIRFLTLARATAVAIGVVSFLSVTLAGQTQASSARSRPAAPAAPAAKTRTPEGFRICRAWYNTATLTPLERPDPNKLVLSEAEARGHRKDRSRAHRTRGPSERRRAAMRRRLAATDRQALPETSAATTNFWLDRGNSTIVVDGQRRRQSWWIRPMAASRRSTTKARNAGDGGGRGHTDVGRT